MFPPYISTVLQDTSDSHRCNSEQDHTYCSVNDTYGMPLAHRLTQFRDENIGCDVEFIVGTEQKVSSQYILHFPPNRSRRLMNHKLIILFI